MMIGGVGIDHSSSTLFAENHMNSDPIYQGQGMEVMKLKLNEEQNLVSQSAWQIEARQVYLRCQTPKRKYGSFLGIFS